MDTTAMEVVAHQATLVQDSRGHALLLDRREDPVAQHQEPPRQADREEIEENMEADHGGRLQTEDLRQGEGHQDEDRRRLAGDHHRLVEDRQWDDLHLNVDHPKAIHMEMVPRDVGDQTIICWQGKWGT